MPTIRRFVVLATVSLLAACRGEESKTENPDAGASAAVANAETDAAPATAEQAASFTGVVAVLPVKDHAASVAWYSQWLGRSPDVVPMDGVAEWNLANNGWIQVSLDPENAGHTTVVVTVRDAEAQRQSCKDAGLNPGEVQDHGVVKLFELPDPDGNKVVFVQEVQAPAAS